MKNGKTIVSRTEFRRNYVLFSRWLFVVQAMYVPIIILGVNNFTDSPDDIWFQRCGSLLVFISIFMQFLFFNFSRMVNETHIDFGDGNIRTEMEDFHLRREGNSQWRSEPSFTLLHEPIIFLWQLVEL
ncbi:hypothetical protein [Pseudoalteromonas sp.]|uniref:hypothetical protein n=1 Tax=Pseudoalteromonas sp. TaxID=53249 RepID=UPI002352B03C|nr:hypothetical protein [Pseudoalteromonas sp.]